MKNRQQNGAPTYEESAPLESPSGDVRHAEQESLASDVQFLRPGDAAAQGDMQQELAARRRRGLRPAPFGRLRRIRLFRSRWVRLTLGLGVSALLLAILAFGLLRVLGPRDKIGVLSMPYTEQFVTVELKKWIARDGVWSLRQDMLAQAANLEKQAQIYLPLKIPTEQPYHLSTYIVLGKSTRGAGVDFNAQYPDLPNKQHQVYIARIEAGAATDGALPAPTMELVAGYTDESGAFVRQVSVPFALDTVEYRLDVYVLGNNYTVQLNGQTMIERRPLFYDGGLVGYMAEGPARFDTLRITTAETRDPGEQVYVSDFDQTPGGAGWVPLSGTWEVNEGELVQANPAAQDAAIGYEGSAFENYVVQATFRHFTGVGGGLLFNMASPYQVNGSYVVRYSEQTDSVFWGFFDESGLFTRQGYFETPPAGTEVHVMAVYVGADSYDIYLDDQLLARNVPFQGATPTTEEGRSGGHIGLVTSFSSVAYSRVEVFPLFDNALMKLPKPEQVQAAPIVGAPPAATATAVSSGDTSAIQSEGAIAPPATPAPTPTPAPRATATPLPANSQLIATGASANWDAEFRGNLATSGWRPISGQWRFDNSALVQNDPDGIDLAIVYTRSAFQDFTYDVSFSHRDGNAAGILFNMPYADRINGAHMVRYSERRPGGIFWGYFDETGKFVGQGYANVDPPADARHRLRVVSGADTYSVYLDDFLLASDLPLRQNFGYVGLVTVQSSARFDQIQIHNAQIGATPVLTPIVSQPLSAAGVYSGTFDANERRIVSGRWEIDQDAYRQSVPDPADYVLNSRIYATKYRIGADIVLPVKPDAGGGFMVHMPERGRKNGATVVRLIRGGDGLFWGVYDATGSFLGRGSVDLPSKSEGDNLYHLQVDVNGDKMQILVDDQLVASDIVLPRAEGWVGLVAYGGPITFTNVQVTVEGTN